MEAFSVYQLKSGLLIRFSNGMKIQKTGPFCKQMFFSDLGHTNPTCKRLTVNENVKNSKYS
jgi:hypothetical protein